MDKFYITTPLYYVNSTPHIGHSYTNIASDILSRYYRLKGIKVFFITGTDEHGQKIKEVADSKGMTPKAFVDSIVPVFIELWKKLNISYDDFIRTTEKRHEDVVKYVLEFLYKKDELYEGEYSGWYCTPCESFWMKTQLIEGVCPDCHRRVEEIRERNWFFRLSRYQTWLIDYITAHKEFILPPIRRNEILAFLKNPLNDLCISRPRSRVSWGVPIPFSPEHVTYVWFDALINYISVCGYLHEPERFREFWPADVHMIGKDILRPHAVYWPIILHAIGLEPPRRIFAHGWWKIMGDKISKSKGNIIDPVEIVDKYGVDAYRYFLLREVPFGLDGSFSEEMLIRRINSDLANDLGNLLSRTVSMIERYFSGTLSEKKDIMDIDELTASLVEIAKDLKDEFVSTMEKIDFSSCLEYIWRCINTANKFIEDKAPWRLFKEGKREELEDILSILYETLRIISVALSPFMPETSKKIQEQLGMDTSCRMTIDDLSWNIARPERRINKGEVLFPRIEVTK